MEETAAQTPTKGYGKRPLWQWILIYLVIAGIIYAVIYYFLFANKKQMTSSGINPPLGQIQPRGY